jgi:hypothetical protein
VGVVESRHDALAAQVHHPRPRPDVRPDLGARADHDDAVAAHGDGLGARPFRVDGVDGRVLEHQVGGLRGGRATACACGGGQQRKSGDAARRLITRTSRAGSE